MRSAVTVNPHIMKAIAEQRIADLRREAVPRPEAKPKDTRTLRLKRSAGGTQTISPARAKSR
jgi:hypothetical protein